jgi:protein-S-isoprenylcysteine O-methyltransferase
MSPAFVGWFPSAFFANFYGIVVLAVLLTDEILPRVMGVHNAWLDRSRDRGSFVAIYLSSIVGFAVGIICRYRNIGIVPAWLQAVGIAIIVLGGILREWAVFLLGRHFSRTVTIQPDQPLITTGPYRWLRHPAYTGMLLTDAAILLGLGTWVGALVMLVLMLIPTLYRIRVEERVLASAFGEQYAAYARRTWRLIPGW